MKGIVFTKFLELVEKEFGLDMVDRIIDQSNLHSKGVYTAVGTYQFSEMLQLLTHLSSHTELAINDLLKAYGLYFFDVLTTNHASIFSQYASALDLLASIEAHIHVHVRKIYPEAELPYFEVARKSPSDLELIYHSSRSMFAFAHGLMERTFEHYNTPVHIDYELIKQDGSEVKFLISTHD